jgi:hypothetical protein
VDTLDIQDLASFLVPVQRLNTNVEGPDYDRRWDLVPDNTVGSAISIQDMAALLIGPTAYPPMFDGQHAFNRTCNN